MNKILYNQNKNKTNTMKKINVKKLNQFLMNQGNSDDMKAFVNMCVSSFLEDETPNPAKIAFLNDLGLLMEA